MSSRCKIYFIGLLFSLLTITYANTPLPDAALSASGVAGQVSFNRIIPPPPVIEAPAYILLDANSGAVIVEHNADEQRAPASLTKIMTMYLISSALHNGDISLDDRVKISEKAWRTGGSKMFVKVDDYVSVEELVQGITVQSGNDASVAMAEFLAGTEEAFTGVMNHTAQLLGMTNSNFTDSNGLPNANHYSSARDMAILSQAVIRDFPEYYDWFSQRSYTYNGIRQPNRNRLLFDNSLNADGLKTGHTNDAGYCLAASAKKEDMRLIAIVLGAESSDKRFDGTRALLNYGFRFYATEKVYDANQAISDVRVWGSENSRVPIGLAEPLYLTLPKAQFDDLTIDIIKDDTLAAPVTRGQVVGELHVVQDNTVILSVPMIALQDANQGSLWIRMSDNVSSLFNRWFGS